MLTGLLQLALQRRKAILLRCICTCALDRARRLLLHSRQLLSRLDQKRLLLLGFTLETLKGRVSRCELGVA